MSGTRAGATPEITLPETVVTADRPTQTYTTAGGKYWGRDWQLTLTNEKAGDKTATAGATR